MGNFIKNNFRTIIFVLFILTIVGGVFLYKYIKENSGTYEPDNQPVQYEMKKYEDNQYTVVNIDDVDVYNAYYKDFLKLVVNNPTLAYNKLTTECKELVFNNDYKEFLKYTKNIDKNILITGKIDRYKVDKDAIHVIDNTNDGYLFYEHGAWNYTVYLSGKIE